MSPSEIQEKYHYRCVVCLSPASMVHHIIPRSLAPGDIDDPDNLVPLCWVCHDRIHREGTARWALRLRAQATHLLALFNSVSD